MLHPSSNLGVSTLNSSQQFHVFPMLGSPELDAAPQVGCHQMDWRGGITSCDLLSKCVHIYTCTYNSVLTIFSALTSIEQRFLTSLTIQFGCLLLFRPYLLQKGFKDFLVFQEGLFCLNYLRELSRWQGLGLSTFFSLSRV